MSDNSERQAQSQYESLLEVVKHEQYDCVCFEDDNSLDTDGARCEVGEGYDEPSDAYYDPLDIEMVRQVKVLLCTGGPAVRLVGELNRYGGIANSWIEHQDWYEGWERLDGVDTEPLHYLLEVYSEVMV